MHNITKGSVVVPGQQNLLLNNNMNMVMSDTPMSSYSPTDCLEMSDVISGGEPNGGQTIGVTNEHYIYVTYPPELKRRLLER